MVFSAEDRVLVKLLRQQNKSILKFPSKRGTLSGFNKQPVRLLSTGHFTFWGEGEREFYLSKIT